MHVAASNVRCRHHHSHHILVPPSSILMWSPGEYVTCSGKCNLQCAIRIPIRQFPLALLPCSSLHNASHPSLMNHHARPSLPFFPALLAASCPRLQALPGELEVWGTSLDRSLTAPHCQLHALPSHSRSCQGQGSKHACTAPPTPSRCKV